MRLFLVLLVASLAFPPVAVAGECADTVMIDSVAYQVPPPWCGNRIDTAQIADPATLVRIPQEFTYQDWNIYVNRETRDAFVAMARAAKKDGILLKVDSGFRSAGLQSRLIKRRLAKGEQFARVAAMVAPPGYSEHETGSALDLVPSEARFAHTEAYGWLKANASKFGFRETYPEGKEDGVMWESWHWRFVGSDSVTATSSDE